MLVKQDENAGLSQKVKETLESYGRTAAGRQDNLMKKRICLFSGVITMTLLEIGSICALVYSAREMNHEALTYSQWYEGCIYGFYRCLLAFIAATGLFLTVWIILICRLKKSSLKKKTSRKRFSSVLFAVFTVLTVVFVLLTIVRHRELESATQENVECLAPYIKAYGNSQVFSLVTFELAAASLFVWLRKRREQKGDGVL